MQNHFSAEVPGFCTDGTCGGILGSNGMLINTFLVRFVTEIPSRFYCAYPRIRTDKKIINKKKNNKCVSYLYPMPRPQAYVQNRSTCGNFIARKIYRLSCENLNSHEFQSCERSMMIYRYSNES